MKESPISSFSWLPSFRKHPNLSVYQPSLIGTISPVRWLVEFTLPLQAFIHRTSRNWCVFLYPSGQYIVKCKGREKEELNNVQSRKQRGPGVVCRIQVNHRILGKRVAGNGLHWCNRAGCNQELRPGNLHPSCLNLHLPSNYSFHMLPVFFSFSPLLRSLGWGGSWHQALYAAEIRAQGQDWWRIEMTSLQLDQPFKVLFSVICSFRT